MPHESFHIRLLPVFEDAVGELVGFVSRLLDLLRARAFDHVGDVRQREFAGVEASSGFHHSFHGQENRLGLFRDVNLQVDEVVVEFR